MTYTTSFPFGEHAFVQGMADLASTILITIEDESESFWCFASFMEGFKCNFLEDGSGMKKNLLLLSLKTKVLDPPLYEKLQKLDPNLFCCFRWILVLFKREFRFGDLLCLWDLILTDLDDDIHVYICFAMLQLKRNQIINDIHETDGLLRVLNSMSFHFNLEKVLVETQQAHKRFAKLTKK
jgi:hypothetical protein